MKYQSTRSAALTASPARAVLEGLAPDGGLYILNTFDALDFDWRRTLKGSTLDMAEAILTALLPGIDDMHGLVRRAYAGKFTTDELTPLVPVGDQYVLELFHGPTSAFKDVALSMLPQLITQARVQEGMTDEIVILTATSGDTGKAALAGFCDVPGTRIIVFYPEQGVSKVQKAQMVSQPGGNVRVCGIRGNFDDAQTGVKNTFSACADGTLLAGKGVRLSSANSINIGRLAPQVVYYFKAYAELVRAGRIRVGDRVDYVVPTGNFGDILAGYFAKRMGLPVGRLVCASNRNDVLTEFLQTGVYDRRRTFYRTLSPSMDILVSSNLERLLYLLCGDCAEVAGYMEALKTEGVYRVSDAMLKKLHEEFWPACCDDEATKTTIGRVWREHGYLMDTHTAVAWNCAEQYRSARRDEPCPSAPHDPLARSAAQYDSTRRGEHCSPAPHAPLARSAAQNDSTRRGEHCSPAPHAPLACSAAQYDFTRRGEHCSPAPHAPLACFAAQYDSTRRGEHCSPAPHAPLACFAAQYDSTRRGEHCSPAPHAPLACSAAQDCRDQGSGIRDQGDSPCHCEANAHTGCGNPASLPRHCEASAHTGCGNPFPPVVVLSTASPYKFPAAVLEAIGEPVPADEFAAMDRLHDRTGVPVPQGLATLRTQPVRHTDVIDREGILDYVLHKIES